MKDFLYSVQDLFLNVLFPPFDALRALELENWFTANTISWIFILIGFVAFVYWMLELKKYNANDEEDKSISSHSYL
ncbi:MAG: uracil phosphoribosyltransferase [Bacteroidetes bacterium MedPE-SWsnd-G2]|nr:MAG: uracil phosphoribosyltransferase [Bacteroidetes bacterium MedPE-SWsnd-G2]